MKNQMVIGEDPKFKQITSQGLCTLEIRKPCTFDGGVYSCKAINPHGEAVVNCKLDVKGEPGWITRCCHPARTSAAYWITTVKLQ